MNILRISEIASKNEISEAHQVLSLIAYHHRNNVNCDQKSSTTCGCLIAHVHSRASKISEKLSAWARFF
jgi:hypothetical protein